MQRRIRVVALALAAWAGAPAAAGAAGDAGPAAPDAPRVPLNFSIGTYARGLDHPGTLLVLPNGDVLVALPHGVTLLRDGVGDGVADVEMPLVRGIGEPLGLALRRDRLYVAVRDALYTCTYLVGRSRLGGRCHPIATWPDRAGAPVRGGLAFNRDESLLYVSLAGGDEPAGVWSLHPDGKDARRVATLAAGALAREPSKGALWTTNAAGALVAMADPSAPVRPVGVAGRVLSLAFYGRDRFPREFRGGLFIAEGGDGDAITPRISYVSFDSARPTGTAGEFVAAFPRGGPDALATTRDGALLVADEARGTVWRVAFRCGACTPDPVAPARHRR